MRLIVAALLVLGAAAAEAEEAKLEHNGLTLNAELATAAGKSLADGVVLLTHGTLMHNRVELIEALQKGLAERGVSSLAPTLSLGVSDRAGAFDCATPHRHKHADAVREIDAWVGWLKARGAQKIFVAGHSRGGAQTALYANGRSDAALAGIVLVAPTLFDAAKVAADYEAAHGRALAPLLERAQALAASGRGDEELTEVDFLYCKNARVAAATFLDYYGEATPKNTPALLVGQQKPVLVVIGGGDRIVAGLGPALAGTAGIPRLDVATIADADHFFRDLYAEDLVDAVAAFVTAN